MTDLVSMPKNIIPYLRTTIEQMGSDDEANFAIYHLGFKWGKETVEMSGEESDIDELKTKTVLTAIHSGITNFDVDVDEKIKISPYDASIDDDYFLAGYAAGVVSGLLGEYHIARIREDDYEVVKSEKRAEAELFKKEEEVGKVEVKNLEVGGAYLIADRAKKAERTFKTFINALEEGMPGLCFTRTFPSKLKERYPDIDSPIFWLSTVDETEEVRTIKPESFHEEMIKISKSFLETKQGIIVLHGMEFLLSYLEFDDLLNTLQQIKDMTYEEGGILLLAVDPESVGEIEFNISRDEFDKLKNEFEMFEL
ncbi:MAG: DUF835 domain-containing protein [Candidatus Thermoplasmatota archaeon]|nr:DUF835 domain-containing protein [Candidatus Thermoplasmatota archaeon]